LLLKLPQVDPSPEDNRNEIRKLQTQFETLSGVCVIQASKIQEISTRLDHTSARASEVADEGFNKSNENRIVIHGLARLQEAHRDQIKAAALNSVTNLFVRIFGSGNFTILRASYYDSEKPVFEATMSSVEEAVRLRRQFGKKSFAERRQTGVRLVNSVTASTRVRLSILKTMGQAYKKIHPSGVFQLLSFLPRPIVKYRPEGTGPLRTNGFVEAVLALPPDSLGLTDDDFSAAYRSAGQKFPNALRELFLVLSDSSPHATEALLPGCPKRDLTEGAK